MSEPNPMTTDIMTAWLVLAIIVAAICLVVLR